MTQEERGFYINGDDYFTLRCLRCEALVEFVEAGTLLADLVAKGEAHVCGEAEE